MPRFRPRAPGCPLVKGLAYPLLDPVSCDGAPAGEGRMQLDQLKRREFIMLLGGAAAWPLAAQAQQRKAATIGVLVGGNPDPGPFIAGLREGLRELGYVEEITFRLEIRSAQGNFAKLPVLARELVD